MVRWVSGVCVRARTVTGGVHEPPAQGEAQARGGQAEDRQAEDHQAEDRQAETRDDTEPAGTGWDGGARVRRALQAATSTAPEVMPAAITVPANVPLVEARRVASLEPVMQVKWLEHFEELARQGIYLQTNDARRTPARQQSLIDATQAALSAADSAAALARAGLTGITGGSNKSLHIYGLAYDGEPRPKTERTWRIYGESAERLGLVWGGRWTRKFPDSGKVVTDRPHVQFPGDSGVLRGLAGAGLLTVLTFGVATVARRTLERG